MALISTWKLDDGSSIAIWKIEEPESFFKESTGLSFDEISNEKRRIERLAGRFLLKYLDQNFPVERITPDPNDKPRVADNQYYFSISHSWPFVTAVIRKNAEAGIDIQKWHPRILKLQSKFLSPEEQLMTRNDEQIITLAWCAKEAAYKYHGSRGIDFIKQLPITRISSQATENIFNISINVNSSKSTGMVNIQGIVYQDFAFSLVIK